MFTLNMNDFTKSSTAHIRWRRISWRRNSGESKGFPGKTRALAAKLLSLPLAHLSRLNNYTCSKLKIQEDSFPNSRLFEMRGGLKKGLRRS